MYEELMIGNIIEVSVPMFDGVEAFKLCDTHGVPLASLLIILMQNRMIIDWKQYINSAEKAGWKEKTIVSRIISACRDSGYGKDYLVALKGENMDKCKHGIPKGKLCVECTKESFAQIDRMLPIPDPNEETCEHNHPKTQ